MAPTTSQITGLNNAHRHTQMFPGGQVSRVRNPADERTRQKERERELKRRRAKALLNGAVTKFQSRAKIWAPYNEASIGTALSPEQTKAIYNGLRNIDNFRADHPLHKLRHVANPKELARSSAAEDDDDDSSDTASSATIESDGSSSTDFDSDFDSDSDSDSDSDMSDTA